MSEEPKVHPMRKRKHRRGKRGGKKHQPPIPLAPTPVILTNLRSRLTQLSKHRGPHA